MSRLTLVQLQPQVQSQPQASNPLAALKDIHLPEAVSAWPPAPGWWLLATMLILLIVAGMFFLKKQRQQNHYRRLALNELQAMAPSDELLTGLNRLLKRVALVAYPRHDIASLSGQAWTRFLQQSCNHIPDHAFAALASGPYQPTSALSAEEQSRLKNYCAIWIKQHAPVQPLDQQPENGGADV